MPQAQWVKACGGLANLVLCCGERAIKLLQSIEKTTSVTPNTFRPLEGMIVPGDFEEVLKLLEQAEKVSPATIKEVAQKVQHQRWISWSLMHSGLDASWVHPSRSVLHAILAYILLSLPAIELCFWPCHLLPLF